MVAHDHRERVAGCFRCALSADEVSMVEQLRQLEQAATPGPWGAADGGSFGGWWLSINGDPSNRTLAAVPEGYLPDAGPVSERRERAPIRRLPGVQGDGDAPGLCRTGVRDLQYMGVHDG